MGGEPLVENNGTHRVRVSDVVRIVFKAAGVLQLRIGAIDKGKAVRLRLFTMSLTRTHREASIIDHSSI